MHYAVLRNGSVRRLLWGSDRSGKFRGRDYFERLPRKDQAKFEPWFDRMAETRQIRNTERFRKETKDIFVFKAFKHRLACFFDGPDLVIVHGFSKKTKRGKKEERELRTAEALRRAYLERKAEAN